MRKLCLLWLAFIILPFPSISCKKLEPRQANTLQKEKLTKLDSIPLQYGSFVNVTVNHAVPRTAELWFQDNDNTIRLVQISLEDRALIGDVIVVPRN